MLSGAFASTTPRGREPARRYPVPKPGGLRWLARLDPADAAEYAGAVARVAVRIELSLGPEVVANRVRRAALTEGELVMEPWRAARRRFLQRARALCSDWPTLLVTDVRDCFGQITASTVRRTLDAIGCREGEIGAVVAILERFRADGVPGLPIGPDPSAVLANAVLGPVDLTLAEIAAHVRWVDDFVVFCRDAERAASALERLRAALATLGLEPAKEKTAIVHGARAVRHALSRGALSGVAAAPATYNRPLHEDALPGIPRPHALAPARGRMAPHRRTPHPAGGER